MHQSHLRKLEWLWFNLECYHAVMWYWDLLLFGVPTLQIGDKLPSVQVMEGTPKDKVNVATLFSGKKGVLFAVPGAFTPGCSKVCVECYVQWFVTEKWGENIILVLKCGRDVDRKVLTVRLTSLVGDHFPYSCDPNGWFRGDLVRRNLKLVILAG